MSPAKRNARRNGASSDEAFWRHAGQYEIERSEVDAALSNLSQVATQARIVPSFKRGKANGFKLYTYKVTHNRDSHNIKVYADITDLEKALKSGVMGHFIFNDTKSYKELYYRFKFLKDGQTKLTAEKLKGLDLKLIIKTPKILSSNAGSTAKNTAIWHFKADNFKTPKDNRLYLKYQD